MKPIKEQLQESLDDSEEQYTLKTDEEIIEMICLFGCGMLEFHTADIERIIVENQRMKKILNIDSI